MRNYTTGKRILTGFIATVIVVLNAVGLNWLLKKNKNKEELNGVNEPQEEQIIDKEEHVHSYGSWEKIDIFEEQRKCLCGNVENREHHYNVITRYISNADNTHKVIRTYICPDCNYSFQTNEKEECSLGNYIYEDNNKIERTCPKCGYVDIYGHTHKWEEEMSSMDEDYEYYRCSKCNTLRPINHNYRTIQESESITLYECFNKGCNYSYVKDDNHEHIYEVVKKDDGLQYWQCSCEDEVVLKENDIDENYEKGIVLERKRKY